MNVPRFFMTDHAVSVEITLRDDLAERLLAAAARRKKEPVHLLADVVEKALADLPLAATQRPQHMEPEWVAQGRQMEDDGMPRQAIAKRFGVAPATVTKWLGTKFTNTGRPRKPYERTVMPIGPIPGWVPVELRAEYAARVSSFGEEEAASWARREKRAKP